MLFRSALTDLAGPTLLGTQAVGFVVVWVIARRHLWVLLPAAALGVVAAADAVAKQPIITPQAQPYFMPLTLIGVGIYLLRSEPADSDSSAGQTTASSTTVPKASTTRT